MSDRPTILLIGLRGSGKTTLGLLLAESLGVGFWDLDALTLDAMGHRTVTEAWDQMGEPAFREAETAALERVIRQQQQHGGVIALGGGTPTAPGAEEVIRESGAETVYLRADPALLKLRLQHGAGADRPSLTGADSLEEIDQVFNDRDARYRVLADHVVALSAHEQPGETLERLVGTVG